MTELEALNLGMAITDFEADLAIAIAEGDEEGAAMAQGCIADLTQQLEEDTE